MRSQEEKDFTGRVTVYGAQMSFVEVWREKWRFDTGTLEAPSAAPLEPVEIRQDCVWRTRTEGNDWVARGFAQKQHIYIMFIHIYIYIYKYTHIDIVLFLLR
jgi:hypothetical protein